MDNTGERLARLRIQSGLTQSEVANALDIDRTAYSSYESNKRLPTSKNLLVLARMFGVSCDYILCESDDPTPGLRTLDRQLAGMMAKQFPECNMRPVPVVGGVTAKYGAVACEDVSGYEYLDLDPDSEHFILCANDESMSPLIRDGDKVVVRKQEVAESGDIVVAIWADGQVSMRKFIQGDGYVILQPFNPHVEAVMVCPSNERPLYIAGRIIKVIHTL